MFWGKGQGNDTEMKERVHLAGERKEVSPEGEAEGLVGTGTQDTAQPGLRVQIGEQPLCARRRPLLMRVEGARPPPNTLLVSATTPSWLSPGPTSWALPKAQRPSVGLIWNWFSFYVCFFCFSFLKEAAFMYPS